jgi:hypothetical protein
MSIRAYAAGVALFAAACASAQSSTPPAQAGVSHPEIRPS